MKYKTDFLIIGSGISGIGVAIKLARLGKVSIIAKKGASDTATNWAQGGIACVLGEDDSFDLHIYDTLKAGDGLSHEDIVRLIVQNAPECIAELDELGTGFTRLGNGDYELGHEGGHSRRRIVHAGDFTGKAIQNALINAARKDPNIELLEHHMAVDIITSSKLRKHHATQVCAGADQQSDRCLGAYVMNEDTGEIITFLATVTIIATGGTGKVYLYTTNPDVATGDGIAMASRAGARVANLEFVQFHPTCLYHAKRKNFLISEALRGEGARLLDYNGRPFMQDYSHELELANRDVVARAIDHELKKSGKEHVYLDISHKDSGFIKKRFPNIYRTCFELGIDITAQPIPVVPAAHYMCGGIVTNCYGETEIAGLFALGETACTGLHGANRLASNSLLEDIVLANQAAKRLENTYSGLKSATTLDVPDWDKGGAVSLDEEVLISHNWDTIRLLMWNYVGIVRRTKRLELANERIQPILKEINQHYWQYILTPDFIELRNIAQVAQLVITCASQRKESRGGHYVLEFPDKDDWNWRRDTILKQTEH